MGDDYDAPNQKFIAPKPIGHVSLEYTPEEDRLIYGRISTAFRPLAARRVRAGGAVVRVVATNTRKAHGSVVLIPDPLPHACGRGEPRLFDETR